MDTDSEASHRGLLKLMLRLPSLRGELQLLWRKDASLGSLCEAYEDATATFERLSKSKGNDEGGLVEEYRALCLDLENDVVARCSAKRIRPLS